MVLAQVEPLARPQEKLGAFQKLFIIIIELSAQLFLPPAPPQPKIY